MMINYDPNKFFEQSEEVTKQVYARYLNVLENFKRDRYGLPTSILLGEALNLANLGKNGVSRRIKLKELGYSHSDFNELNEDEQRDFEISQVLAADASKILGLEISFSFDGGRPSLIFSGVNEKLLHIQKGLKDYPDGVETSISIDFIELR